MPIREPSSSQASTKKPSHHHQSTTTTPPPSPLRCCHRPRPEATQATEEPSLEPVLIPFCHPLLQSHSDSSSPSREGPA
ncbi:hypothetical protein M0R45_005969 [Rubus argutus]|uniref:Uncharacterized protein n=1 Tax=Rubus argutus TaxID=59490 RepID=A0AAW1YP47_RUBAR